MRSARERLVHHVRALERLEAEKAAAAEALRDGFVSARRAGYDVATLKVVLRLRKMSPAERAERRALEAIYLASLGMLEGDPLPDEARRRLDDENASPQKEERDPPGRKQEPAASAPQPAVQATMPLKDPKEARAEGVAAAEAGKRIYDNPYPAGDPCRAAWDEGWCAKKKSHGMETPAAYQRRTGSSDEDKKDKDADAGEKKGAA